MRFRKVLLISPYYGGSYSGVLPAGLGYIAESLEHHRIAYDVLDLQSGYTQRGLYRTLMRLRPDLVGFSLIAFRYQNVYKMAQQIKEWLPQTRIVLGGPFISTFRQQALRDCSAIDYGIVLEGEKAIVELCAGGSLHSIKGLVFRDDTGVVYTGDRPFLEDLDAIDFPRYAKFSLDRYPSSIISIVSSRGCPYDCVYCPAKLSIGRRFRVRKSDSVVEELAYWYGRGFRRFGFADDNFTFYPERVHEICGKIEARRLKGMELVLGNGIRADRVDEDLLLRMKRVGFRHIAFGVESAKNHILRSLRKSETIEQIEKAIDAACRLGMDVKLHFIIGSPGETLADVRDSLALALKYPVCDASFNNLIPYPGTELFRWASENGYLLYPPEKYLNEFSTSSLDPVFATPEFSEQERREALRAADWARRKILKRNYACRLSGWGALAGLAAAFAATPMLRKHLVLHPGFRRLAKRLAGLSV